MHFSSIYAKLVDMDSLHGNPELEAAESVETPVESAVSADTSADAAATHAAPDNSESKSSRADFWPRGSRKNTEISLGGTKVKVRTDATPASMKQIRELVEEKFTEFADKLQKGVSTHQLTVLVAFNLAEELLKERERNRVLKKKTVEWAERLLDRVESHLANNN